MAIALDGSSPAGVSQTNGATQTVVSGSFTPPAGSVVVVSWQANSQSGAAPTAPTISNTGSLSFTSLGLANRADTGANDGQAAMWYAVVGSSPGAMTVTVTNNATSGNRHARLKVDVLTGVNTSSPVGASGEGSDDTQELDTLTYTSTTANSVGIASVSDWDVVSTTFTAASGTTIDDSASVASSINCATLRQTTPTTSGSTISLGLTSPTSTNWNFVYAEFKPATGTTATAEGPAGSGAANDAVVGVQAAAEAPAGTGTGNDARAAVAAAAQGPAGSGAAYDATVGTGATYDTLYTGGTLPTFGGSDDDSPLTVGVAFSCLVAGTVAGVRVHTATTETGNWTVQLHDAAGTLLGSGTGPTNPGAGDYDVLFSSPVTVDTSTIYVVSVFHPEGRYSYTASVYSGDYTSPSGALFAGLGGSYGPGRYAYGGAAAFPNVLTSTWYGAEPLFVASSSGATTAPGEGPAGTGTANDATVAITAAAENAAGTGASDNAVAGQGTAVAAQSAAGTGTANDATVAITAAAENAAGSGTANQATIGGGAYETLFDGSPPTFTGSTTDSVLTLGQAFSLLVAGHVVGVRVKTGIAETGNWTVKLYDGAGTELASATGPTDPGSGSYDVLFSGSVAVDTSTIYTAAVFHPQGKYSYTTDEFTGDLTAANGHVFAGLGGSYGPGRYAYSASPAYPNTLTNDWYGIEPLFTPDATGTTAPAESAAGSGTANNATVAITANAEAPTGTGAALWDSTGDSISLILTAQAAVEATGAAYDATIGTSGSSTATPGAAAGSGTANDATVAITAAAAAAAASGASGDAAATVMAAGGVATGSGTAGDAAAGQNLAAPAEHAAGAGAAYDAAVAITAAGELAAAAGASTGATATASTATPALSASREAIRAALETVAGLVVLNDYSGVPVRGQAWVWLGDLVDVGLPTRVAKWRVIVVAGGDPQTAIAFLDTELLGLLAALRPVMFVDSVNPVSIGAMHGIELLGRREF